MKKIMFNDTFCLTKAVLDGTKTMTRRVVPLSLLDKYDAWYEDFLYKQIGLEEYLSVEEYVLNLTTYKVGEVVAIAQSYYTISNPQYDKFGKGVPGNSNKMFTRADLMPHHIQITGVKIERFQSISDEDCTKEGVDAFLKVICEKASEKYEKKSDNIYWITGRGYDQSLSYCHNCARKEVEALNQEIGKGYEKYIADGGWGVEDEHPCFCEKCGKPLLFDFCGNVDLELPNLDLRHESDLYILNQILSQDDEDAEKVIRYFAREAFSLLIDKVSGKGTWESNPWVVAYSFELVD